jgi:D-alanyl-lipoteichoic acid acyltransferase DltB (MBOAT superfamily)
MVFKPSYGLLLLLITTIDYVAGRLMGTTEDQRKRRLYLILSLAGNIGILFVFKYFNFLFGSIADALTLLKMNAQFPVWNLILPIGISFHTFQSISYTIEVYRRKVEPVHHFGRFALFVSFFPQLVAGPIERPTGLLPQFLEDRLFDLGKARSGLKLMAWGFFKKIVIADNLAPIVTAAYANPSEWSGPSLAIATAAFAWQIYCDFSGYTDIARGAARVLGYDLMLNFNRPYLSRSVSEFWRRWHISLSSWFRDYVYIPLGGSRGSRLFTARNIMITFLLSGLWHGANWTFVIWGGLNGLFIVIGQYWSEWKSKNMQIIERQWRKSLEVGATFSLICVTWVFFRAESVTHAWSILTRFPKDIGEFFVDLTTLGGLRHSLGFDMGTDHLAILIIGLTVLFLRESSVGDRLAERFGTTLPRLARYGVYTLGIFLLFLLSQSSAPQQFIYFQF